MDNFTIDETMEASGEVTAETFVPARLEEDIETIDDGSEGSSNEDGDDDRGKASKLSMKRLKTAFKRGLEDLDCLEEVTVEHNHPEIKEARLLPAMKKISPQKTSQTLPRKLTKKESSPKKRSSTLKNDRHKSQDDPKNPSKK